MSKACVLRAVSALVSQGYEAGRWTPVPFYWSVSERDNWSGRCGARSRWEGGDGAVPTPLDFM